MFQREVTMVVLPVAFLYFAGVAVDAFAPEACQLSRRWTQASHRAFETSRPAATTFMDGLRVLGSTPRVNPKVDVSKLGSLEVPNVGIGTISWSSTNRTLTVCILDKFLMGEQSSHHSHHSHLPSTNSQRLVSKILSFSPLSTLPWKAMQLCSTQQNDTGLTTRRLLEWAGARRKS